MANEKAFLAMFVGYGAGLWCTVSALRRSRAMAQAQHWPGIRGKVLESVEYQDPARKATHFRIRYEFTVGDRIEGRTPRLSGDWFWSNAAQSEFVGRYVAGEAVEVFYDPRDPHRNCLDRADRSGITALWMIAAAGTLLASLLVWLQFFNF
jgi:hypothetical protein